jgi:uncharacterized protein (DUF58 family)
MRWSRRSSPKPASAERLLDEGLLWALRGLSLPRRTAHGAVPGAHRGGRPGRGEDFFQHRAYVSGEDLRMVDFRASARSAHLLVKELHRPLRQPLVVVVDQSASMGMYGKGRCARQVGAAFALLAVRRGDPVTVLGVDGPALTVHGRLFGLAHPALAVERAFAGLPEVGQARLFEALAGQLPFASMGAHLVVVSDLYGEVERARAAFARSTSRGAALTVLHVLAAEERSLPAGQAGLRDVETGEEAAVGGDAGAEYERRVAAWRQELERTATGFGGEWHDADTAEPVGLMLRRWLSRTR